VFRVEILCRLLRLLHDVYNHAVELFRVLFYQPRFVTSEVEDLWKSAVVDARRYVHAKLGTIGNHIEVISNSSICSSSYLFFASMPKSQSV